MSKEMTPQEKEIAKDLFNKYGGCVIKESTCERIVGEIQLALQPKKVSVDEIYNLISSVVSCVVTNEAGDRIDKIKIVSKQIHSLIYGKEK